MELTEIETVHAGWTRLLVGQFRYPDGTCIRREIEDHGEAATVLTYDPERGVALLVRQFRAAVFMKDGDGQLIEAIAGLTEGGEALACARREAMEEAGLRLASLEHVATLWSLPGLSTERMALYLAPYAAADRSGPGGGNAGENEIVEVVEIGLAELAAMADRGELTDMKTFALVQTLRLRRPDLFSDEPSRVV